MKDNFWMVWDPQGRAPTYKHGSFMEARAEAARLAGRNPGHDFHVLENCGHATKNDIVWVGKRGNANSLDDDLPF